MAARHSPFGGGLPAAGDASAALPPTEPLSLRPVSSALAELCDLRQGLDETAATSRRQEQRVRKQRASLREVLRQLEEAEERVDGVQRRVDSASKALERIGRTVDGHERTSIHLEQRVPAVSFKHDAMACAPSPKTPSCAPGESQDMEEIERRLSQKFERRLAEEAQLRALAQQEVLGVLSQGVQQLRMEHARHVSDFDEKLRLEQRKFRQRVSESQTRHAEHESRADALETRLDSVLSKHASVEHRTTRKTEATRKTELGEERKKVQLPDPASALPTDYQDIPIHHTSLDAGLLDPPILEKTASEKIFVAQKEALPHQAHLGSNQIHSQTRHHAHCNIHGDVPFNLQGQQQGCHHSQGYQQGQIHAPAVEAFPFNPSTTTIVQAATVTGAAQAQNYESRPLQCKHISNANEKFPDFGEWLKKHEAQHENMDANQQALGQEESTQALQHEHRQLHGRHPRQSTHESGVERDWHGHELHPRHTNHRGHMQDLARDPSVEHHGSHRHHRHDHRNTQHPQHANNHGHTQDSPRDPSVEHHDSDHHHRHHDRHKQNSANLRQERHRRHKEQQRSLEHSIDSQDHRHSQHITHETHHNNSREQHLPQQHHQQQQQQPQMQSTHHPHPEVLHRLQALEARIRDSSEQRRRSEDPSSQVESKAEAPARKRPSEVPVTVELAQTWEATSQGSTPRLANYSQNHVAFHSAVHANEGTSCQPVAGGLAPPKGLTFEPLSLPSSTGSTTATAMPPSSFMILQADPLGDSSMAANIVPALPPASPALQHAAAALAVHSGTTTPRSGMPDSPGRHAVLARARPVVMLPPAPSSIVSETSMEMTGRSSLGSPSMGPWQLRSDHSPPSPSAMSSCNSPPMPPQPLRDTPSFAMRLPSPPRTPLSTRGLGNGH